jgi:hypothetical protein
MGLAPDPQVPERVTNVYEVKGGPDMPGGKGPLRFEEGLGTAPQVPGEFVRGIMQGIQTAPGRPNHNANVYEKYPDETLRERAHPGSAAWVEAPTYLGAFAGGTSQEAELRYIAVTRNGGRQERRNAAEVMD